MISPKQAEVIADALTAPVSAAQVERDATKLTRLSRAYRVPELAALDGQAQQAMVNAAKLKAAKDARVLALGVLTVGLIIGLAIIADQQAWPLKAWPVVVPLLLCMGATTFILYSNLTRRFVREAVRKNTSSV